MRRIDTPSGLFMRRCSHCGLKLQLLSLHTLVLVGLHLSRSGCKNKTLFDILACLLCLLSYGANPTLTANISLQALLGNEEVDECSHQELDPAEPAEKVLTSLKTMLSQELSIGWQVICNVIRRSQSDGESDPPSHGQPQRKGKMNDRNAHCPLSLTISCHDQNMHSLCANVSTSCRKYGN